MPNSMISQISIEQQTKIAKEKLLQKSKQKTDDENTPFQGLLFVGNRHETVPLRLLTDRYLTPRAKTAWQLIKLNAYQFQGSVFPSYNELALWLSDRAFQQKAVSRKIVSQTLLLLRLTRWLTLCETVRNERGQVLGNVYIMNDEPLSVIDSLQLNGDYLRLLEKSAKHSDPLVKDVANAIIDEISSQNNASHFVSHLAIMRERYAQQHQSLGITQTMPSLPNHLTQAVEKTQALLLSSLEHHQSSDTELSQNNKELSQKIDNLPSSKMELSQENDDKSLILGLVPERNSATQYGTSTYVNKKYSTGTVQVDVWQTLKLTPLEIRQAQQAMYGLDSDTVQAILFEAQERIAKGGVRKPASYLIGLIRRAKEGEFKPYCLSKSAQATAPKATSIKPPVSEMREIKPCAPLSPEVIQERTAKIAELMTMLCGKRI